MRDNRDVLNVSLAILLAASGVANGCSSVATGPAIGHRGDALSSPAPGGTMVMGFENDAFGNPITRGATLDEQYADWGVHFQGGYLVGERTQDFPDYSLAPPGNMLCTYEAGIEPVYPVTWTPGRCFGGQPPLGTPLTMNFDFPVCFVSVEGRNRATSQEGNYGHVTLSGYDETGAPAKNAQDGWEIDAPFDPSCKQGNCPTFREGMLAAATPLDRLSYSPPTEPIQGTNIRSLSIFETNIGSLDNVKIDRCEELFPVCSCPVLCVPPGQCSLDLDIDGGSYDVTGRAVTHTQSPPGPYPIGTTAVTLTADNGSQTRACQGSVTITSCIPPAITCPPDAVVRCRPGAGCGTYQPRPAVVIDECQPSVPSPLNAPPNLCFPPGKSTYSYVAAGSSQSSCDWSITAVDDDAPVVRFPRTDGVIELPPDGELHVVTLADCGVKAFDRCEGEMDVTQSGQITCVTSHEEPISNDPADPDITLINWNTVRLRAARDSRGEGREYKIDFDVRDAAGNTTSSTCKVIVPSRHGRRRPEAGKPRQTACQS